MSTLNAMQNDIGLGVAVNADQYLTFMLAGEEYGVDILRVQEIKGWGGVRVVPDVPPYLKGVLNLRGALVPVLDLRLRFGLGQAEYSAVTVIIVVMVHDGEREIPLGLVADAVSDVLEVAPDEFKAPPRFGQSGQARFMSGMVTKADRMVVVLEVDRLLKESDLESLAELSA